MRLKPSLKSVLDISVSVVLLVAAGIVIWRQFPALAGAKKEATLKVPVSELPVSDAPVAGDPNAQVVLVEYSDFECPFCARFVADTLPTIRREYVDSGRVQMAFRHMPLDRIHKFAQRAAEAAACADDQRKFWPMHDSLFGRPEQLDDPAILARVPDLGLDLVEFKTCFGTTGRLNPKTEVVDKDTSSGRKLGITATPAFLIGRRTPNGGVRVLSTLLGSRPLKEFAAALDQAAAEAGQSGSTKGSR